MIFGNQHNLQIELVICWLRAQYVVSKSTLSNCDQGLGTFITYLNLDS